MNRLLRVCLLASGLVFVLPAGAWEYDTRTKLFGSEAWLPARDLQRTLDDSPAYDASADLRSMFRESIGGWHLIADHTLLYEGGDTYAFVSVPEVTQTKAYVSPPSYNNV